MGSIAGKLSQVNGRLRLASVGVAVEQRGDRLRLRATLPPKPGSDRNDPYQQRISLGFPANLAGLREAEKRARLLGAQLIAREFDWAEWGLAIATPQQRTCGEWIDLYKTHYLGQGGTETTWEGDYAKPLKRLPMGEVLTPELLETMVLGTKANTRSRQRATMAAGAIAKFAGLAWDGSRLRGNYSPSKVEPRDLPTDEAIAHYRDGLTNPAWQWVYGIMATYGLRNHEVFHLDLSRFPVVQVLESTKTGAREVWPCYPEWAEQWHLGKRMLPPVQLNRSNQAIGHSVTKYLSPKLPFLPYDLRHAWAVRTLLYHWPVELSAHQMGHSVEVHTRTYQRWISGQQIQGIYDLLVNRPDRPRPPSSHSALDSAPNAIGR